jgi:TatD DNase family protein
VWATVGLHPHEADRKVAWLEPMLRRMLEAGAPVVAVGECGLDYHYDHAPRAAQRTAFEAQAELAARLGLALVVHTREALDDTVAILEAAGPPPRTVVHCFTGGPDDARRLVELGCSLSFSGIVTFRNAAEVRQAAQACPLDRILVETDAPFLAPVPHRGKPNEPAWVAVVGEALAALRGLAPEAFAEATTENARRLYGLDDLLHRGAQATARPR